MSKGPGDNRFAYHDAQTGVTYDVRYDYYTDPSAVVIASIRVDGKLVRVSREVKNAIENAAMADYRAWIAERNQVLRDEATRSK